MTKRNCSIDIFRYICAIMVVAIHSSPFTDINKDLGYIFTEIVPRIAVPFFFITSGYFYIKGLEKGSTKFKAYLLSLLKTYAIWSTIYYVIDFISWGHSNLKAFLAHLAHTFLITGSHYHFWFFPALIVSVCFVTLIYKLKLQKGLLPISILLYIIGCLGCSYRTIGLQIPGLSVLFELESFVTIRRIFFMAIPFFAAGASVERIRSVLPNGSNKRLLRYGLLLGVIILWLAEIVLVTHLNWSDNIAITVGLYPLVVITLSLLLEYPCSQNGKLAGKCRTLADFTYYVHPLVIIALQKLADVISVGLGHTLLFILTIVISALALYVCCNIRKLLKLILSSKKK